MTIETEETQTGENTTLTYKKTVDGCEHKLTAVITDEVLKKFGDELGFDPREELDQTMKNQLENDIKRKKEQPTNKK